jgi:Cd2+/Zn2+-exporting ATPase
MSTATLEPASEAVRPAASHRVEEPPVLGAVLAAVCLVATIGGAILRAGPAAMACFAVAYLAGGVPTTIAAARDLARGRLNIDLLMILAAAGAAALGDWLEGAVLLFLFALSNALESYALYRTTRSIDALIRLRPREALRLDSAGDGVVVPVDSLVVGDRVRVKPGEAFPVDGVVVEGTTWANEATLTGESAPVGKAAGDEVFAGTHNGEGSVVVRMTRGVGDTRLEAIVRLVREAQAAQTPTQRLVERWQQPYVLGVLLATGMVAVGSWWLHDRDAGDAFYHAMVLMVALSPCAVVIGAPAVTLSAIARAARHGVLFKGGAYLERLGEVGAIAFDKTGTITPGKPGVTDVEAVAGTDADRLLARAAAVEARSEHHLGRAVVEEASRRGLEVTGEVRDFHAHAGQGVHGVVDGEWIGVGREGLFAAHDVALPPGVLESAERLRRGGRTALLAVVDGPLAQGDAHAGGVIGVADAPRPEAARALAALRRLGVRELILLTGDHRGVAEAVAAQVGADRVVAGLMPEEKVVELRRLASEGRVLAMVGDGVNDAPALAAADVGIAMGGAGTDVALEVADVVLMRDDLGALPFAVWLGRLARRRVGQNLAFAFGMIGLLAVGSFLGLPLWLGVIGHEGSTVLVVLNGLRMLWERPPAELLGG